jgi:hypothetical protein
MYCGFLRRGYRKNRYSRVSQLCVDLQGLQAEALNQLLRYGACEVVVSQIPDDETKEYCKII